ncbi:helix-turn-helix domain-containing protein [Comamonas thiooxydans]|uniref:helix-turn-helix domain-containing protein n=1 Tax=Comamonas thiooxydans TaxID=363952 RepID=UPI000B41EF03|nr:helix-turn-helix domain-containing protein [Comamonas thiooxydans]
MGRHKEYSPPPALVAISTPTEVGEYIRASRKAQNMRIDDTAGLNNVSVDLLSRLENGAGGVRLDKLITVLNGLGLKLIIGEADEVARLMQSRTER